MAAAVSSSPIPHSPPKPDVKRPKGILKNSFQRSPPISPRSADHNNDSHATPPSPRLTDKELTIQNTQYNAGHRRSSSAARPGVASRRQSSRTPSHQGDAEGEEESNQRLKWDEANLYLTEQDRTSTMKIDEPKTPYAKHYDPAEDPSDDEADVAMVDGDSSNARRLGGGGGSSDEIPGLSLGEPEEAVPEEFVKHAHRPRAVHVDDSGSGHDNDDDEMEGLSAEEREKHLLFNQLRKKHYEMKDVAQLLGHPEDLDDMEDEDDDEEEAAAPPPVPPIPNGHAA